MTKADLSRCLIWSSSSNTPCELMCFLRFPFCLKADSQMLHLKGFSFVWTLKWSNKFHFLENSLLHPCHEHFKVVLTLKVFVRWENENLTFEKIWIFSSALQIHLSEGGKRILALKSPVLFSTSKWELAQPPFQSSFPQISLSKDQHDFLPYLLMF